MITLEQFRNWLRGDDVPGMPKRRLSRASQPDVVESHHEVESNKPNKPHHQARAKFTSLDAGRDAVVRFGKHKGRRPTEIAKLPEGPSYMEWMLTQSFDEKLLETVEHVLADHGPKLPKRKLKKRKR